MTSAASEHNYSRLDIIFMAEALRLAAKGIFTTSPNPNVGCVIADADGTVVGRGYHAKAGEPHAEVHALRQAGARAAGATAYVTLEPCSHFGRTPPCANALIDAGIARVVVAMQDPYHEVAGRGLATLREAGIEVSVGLFGQHAAALNRGFIKRATQGLPYVRVKLAQTLDGRTALANGYSKWITGDAARHDVQFGRAQSAAILTGAGTVMADDPLLNVRLSVEEYQHSATLRRALGDSQLFAELAPYLDAKALRAAPDLQQDEATDIRQPTRVIVDNRCEIHDMLQLWQVPSPVWLAAPTRCQGSNHSELPEHGEHIWVESGADPERIDLGNALRELAARGVNEVWVEAGATLAGVLMQANLVDELIVYTAPKLMGPDAAGLINLPTLSSMDQVTTMRFNEVERIGDDIKFVVRVSDV